MNCFSVLSLSILIYLTAPLEAGETILSSLLTPEKPKTLQRTPRSYYDQRYARPMYERLEQDRPTRCGRCQEDRYDDFDRRDRFDDDRRSQRPSYGNRYDDRNRPHDDDMFDRRSEKNNGTDEGDDGKDDRRNRDKVNRNRYDDRDRYRPDYYDRFLRDPYRERERLPYDDPYRRGYDRPYDRPYDRYDDGYGRYDGYRRQVYDDRFDRGNGYDDAGYGSYSPGAGRGPHDSFRPWDETYRGQAGWDAGGRGYYFASGRPEAGPGGWRSERPESSSGWQNVGYPAQRDPLEYRGSLGYSQDGYRQDFSSGYRPSGWHSVGDRRPYRDQSGLQDTRGYRQPPRQDPNEYGSGYGQGGTRVQSNTFSQTSNAATSSSTTPGNSYLYEREDSQATTKVAETSTKAT